jgi:hypothetical protein
MKRNKIIILGFIIVLIAFLGGDGWFISKEIKITIGISLLLYGLYLKLNK